MDQRALRRFGAFALVGALALGGCGRKGPLELPPDAPGQAPSEAAQAHFFPPRDFPGLIQPSSKVDQPNASPTVNTVTSTPKAPINGPASQSGKSFVLDPLL